MAVLFDKAKSPKIWIMQLLWSILLSIQKVLERCNNDSVFIIRFSKKFGLISIFQEKICFGVTSFTLIISRDHSLAMYFLQEERRLPWFATLLLTWYVMLRSTKRRHVSKTVDKASLNGWIIESNQIQKLLKAITFYSHLFKPSILLLGDLTLTSIALKSLVATFIWVWSYLLALLLDFPSIG